MPLRMLAWNKMRQRDGLFRNWWLVLPLFHSNLVVLMRSIMRTMLSLQLLPVLTQATEPLNQRSPVAERQKRPPSFRTTSLATCPKTCRWKTLSFETGGDTPKFPSPSFACPASFGKPKTPLKDDSDVLLELEQIVEGRGADQDGLEEAVEGLEADADGAEAAEQEGANARPGPRRMLHADSFRWGPFYFTYVPPEKRPPNGQWAVTCPFHAKSVRTDCTKSMAISGPTLLDKEKVRDSLKLWCLQADACTRKSEHSAVRFKGCDIPAEAILQARLGELPAPPDRTLIIDDETRDRLEAEEARNRGRAGRPKAKAKGKAKAGRAPKAKALAARLANAPPPEQEADDAPAAAAASTTSSHNSSSSTSSSSNESDSSSSSNS